MLIKHHHLKDLPAPLTADIQVIMKMRLQADFEQEAIANLLEGQDLQKALKNAFCDMGRLLKPSGWVSFDDEPTENFDGKKKKSLKETVAAEMVEMEECRATSFDSATESLLKLLEGGTAALGRQLGVSQRRAQQLLKKYLEKGNGEQGDLFGGVKP